MDKEFGDAVESRGRLMGGRSKAMAVVASTCVLITLFLMIGLIAAEWGFRRTRGLA